MPLLHVGKALTVIRSSPRPLWYFRTRMNAPSPNQRLSTVAASMVESATLAMARRSRELRAQGVDIIDLSLGEPDQDPPGFAVEAAARAVADNKWNKYPPVNGYADVREAIANKFARDNDLVYSPDQILLSNGAKQSIMNVLLALVGPGDEVVLPAPYWVSYAEQVRITGAVPVPVHSTLDENYKPPVERIAAAITPRTRLLLFSSPCNPSGSVLNVDELEALAAVVRQWPDLLVMSDEIYEHIVFEGSHRSFAALPGMAERTITVNGLAKAFALTGWRVGFIGAPLWITQAATKIQGQFTSGINGVAQRVAKACMEADPAELNGLRADFVRRRDLVTAGMARITQWRCNKPQGAFYVLPDVTASLIGPISTPQQLAMYLLDKARVSLVDGEAFGAPGTLRISYATSDTKLVEALDRLAVAVNELHQG